MDKVETLIHIREQLGLTQTEFAEKTGIITQGQLSEYENRKNGLTWERFFELMRTLSIKIEVKLHFNHKVLDIPTSPAKGIKTAK